LAAIEIPIGGPVDLSRPLRPTPFLSLRPWAGSRLGAGVGEVWVAGPGSIVVLEDGSSATLDELAADAGEAMVGSAGLALLGPRFPLLAKLIDTADWLSLQVHPDDELARRLYGPQAVGKDEVWLVLDAAASARVVVGAARTLERGGVAALIAGGTMDLAVCEVRSLVRGEALDVRAGTIHAIGPGSFIYELEQPSDLTFRISDWGRPPTPGRPLHLAEAGQAVDASLHAEVVGKQWRLDDDKLEGRRIRLELVRAGLPAIRRPGGRSPEIVTAVGGEVTLAGAGFSMSLAPLETAVLPAAIGSCEVVLGADAMAVIGSLPG
jgi:mannose-6-phosphate isomerase